MHTRASDDARAQAIHGAHELLQGKPRGDTLENTDQLICEDIEKFSSAFADVYSQSLKPIVDFVLFSFKMGQYMGVEGPLGMYTWFVVAVAISAKVAPRYGKLAAAEQTRRPLAKACKAYPKR